jgi:hypothetical protein
VHYRPAYGKFFPAAQKYMPPLRFSPGIFSVIGFLPGKISLLHSGKFGQVKNKTEHLIRVSVLIISISNFQFSCQQAGFL